MGRTGGARRTDADPRRRIPRTDALLADPRLAALAAGGPGARERTKAAIGAAQAEARAGRLTPEDVADDAVARLAGANAPGGTERTGAQGAAPAFSSLGPVLNATGIVVHTNLGRAPLSPCARDAIVAASGYTDVELDLATGTRSPRGEGAVRALLDAVPAAEAALPVNNGAAALLLAVTALAAAHANRAAATGDAPGAPEVLVSRGELVEIGAGFRLPDLMASTGVALREVGTTNRTHRADYERAASARTAAVVKIHPANYRVEGFTSDVGAAELADLRRPDGTRVPLVVDIGSGLFERDRALPDEPDASTALRAGADLVTCSGDKLLGGPQAGIVLGAADAVGLLRTHPLARAVRLDKLTLAALEATVREAAAAGGGTTGAGPAAAPVTRYRRRTPDDLRKRTKALAAATGGDVVDVVGHVGGGGAPGVPLPGLAVALRGAAEATARALRTGTPAVLARVSAGRCLVDLRCIEPEEDAALTAAVLAAIEEVPR